MRHIFLFATSLFMFLNPVLAEDAPELGKDERARITEIEEQVREVQDNLVETLESMSEELDDSEKEHFSVLYGNHNLIATVEAVIEDVKAAVDACEDNDREISKKLSERFESWRSEITPKLEEAKGQVNNMIIAQDYRDEEDIRNILDKADQIRALNEEIVTKIPVSTEKACAKLYETLSDTKERLIDLLNTTLKTIPVKLQSPQEQ